MFPVRKIFPARKLSWPQGVFRSAAVLATLSVACSGACWGAPAASAESTGSTGPQPGIVESGLNTWTISSTPSMASIKTDRKAHDALPEAIKEKGVLTIGAVTDEPPFIFITGGKLQGIDVDMIGGVAKALGIKIRLVKTSFEAMIPGLKAGRFDAVMGDLTDTAAREKVVNFVDYLENGQTVIVRKGETRDFSRPLNLCGYSAAAPKGSLSARITAELSHICTDKGLKPIELKTYPGSAPVFLALDLGRVDVSPITYAIATYLVKQHPEKYALTENLFYKSYKGAAVLKGRDDLFKALGYGFQAVVGSPNYSVAISHWGLGKVKADKVYTNVPGEPLSRSIH